MEIRHEENKILIIIEGKEVGKITWIDDGHNLVVDHTFVSLEFRGHHYAKVLVDEVVKYARDHNKKIIPVCSYVDKVLNQDLKYHDILEKNHNYNPSCKI